MFDTQFRVFNAKLIIFTHFVVGEEAVLDREIWIQNGDGAAVAEVAEGARACVQADHRGVAQDHGGPAGDGARDSASELGATGVAAAVQARVAAEIAGRYVPLDD